MARGWHGLSVGDRVRYKLFNTFLEGKIVFLSNIDKNGGLMETDGGETIKIICERCEKINE